MRMEFEFHHGGIAVPRAWNLSSTVVELQFHIHGTVLEQ